MLLASTKFCCFDKFAAVDRDRTRVCHDLAEDVLQRFVSALRVCACLPMFPHVVQHPGAGGQTLQHSINVACVSLVVQPCLPPGSFSWWHRASCLPQDSVIVSLEVLVASILALAA